MTKARVMLVDDCAITRKRLCGSLKQCGVDVVAEAKDGKECLSILERLDIDVVLLDLVMPMMDGFEVLELINKMAKAPKVIMLSDIVVDYFITKSVQLGAYYIMSKAGDCLPIAKRIEDAYATLLSERKALANQDPFLVKNKTLEERVSNIFVSIGIPAHIKGYQYLRDAIIISVEQPYAVNSITKTVYPALAMKYDTSPTRVERAIRHAIEVAWTRGRVENINRLFGFNVYIDKARPTNGEFIALVADKLFVESRQTA